MNGEVTFMNCRQYINAVSNRSCYSSQSSSHHKTTTKHFAGRRYYYLPNNPSVLSGARYRAVLVLSASATVQPQHLQYHVRY